jgi:hypothetical protein
MIVLVFAGRARLNPSGSIAEKASGGESLAATGRL